MTTRLQSLENALFELARTFAEQLVRQAIGARIDELIDVTHDAAQNPRTAFPVKLPDLAIPRFVAPKGTTASTKRPTAGAAVSKNVAQSAVTPRRRGRPRKNAVTKDGTKDGTKVGTKVGSGVGSRRHIDPVESDDAGMFDNMITDPSLLLGAISAEAAFASPSLRASHARQETSRAKESGLLGSVKASTPTAKEQGPALRPGERMQRTAGGAVVLLRRGRK